jgi:hypothetical protein
VRNHPLKNVLGNVTISTYIDEDGCYQVNFLLLVKLYNACPRLNVQLRINTSHRKHDVPVSQALLCVLLNKHKIAIWIDILEKFVSHGTLVVGLTSSRHQVFIHVGEEYAEHWRYGSGERGDWTKYEWATRVGLIPDDQKGRDSRGQKRLKILF